MGTGWLCGGWLCNRGRSAQPEAADGNTNVSVVTRGVTRATHGELQVGRKYLNFRWKENTWTLWYKYFRIYNISSLIPCQQNLDPMPWSPPWHCYIKLSMCKHRRTQIQPHCFEWLSLWLVDGHGKGNTYWELTSMELKGEFIVRGDESDPREEGWFPSLVSRNDFNLKIY